MSRRKRKTEEDRVPGQCDNHETCKVCSDYGTRDYASGGAPPHMTGQALDWGYIFTPPATFTPSAYSSPFTFAEFKPPAEPEPLPVEQSTEVVTGFRQWNVQRSYPDGVRLVSAHTGEAIEPFTKMVAQCTSGGYAHFLRALGAAAGPKLSPPPSPRHPEEAPAQRCQCGIYAYRDRVELRDEGLAVVGEVSLWGRVIVCEKGYRAQFAYPKRLAVVNGSQRLAADLEVTYGVPCEVWS